MSASIEYRVLPSSLEAHIFTVVLTVADPDPEGQVLSLPAWIPGSYMIRDFAKDIVRITANCSGKSVKLSKLDKQTWKAEIVSGVLVIEYEVYAWDLSVRTAHLDTTHGFFNGTSLFLRVVGQEDRVHLVHIQAPSGNIEQKWKLATTLPEREVHPNGFGEYTSESYAQLIDHPVEMADFQELRFQVRGIPHRMTFSGRCYLDKDRISHDIQKICSYHASFFGELPVEQYLFMTLVTGNGYGGLEHLDSTALMCKREDLPVSSMDQPDKGYRSFLGLCSHEYFHLWNVKRIQPLLFQQADLSAEVYTQLLWAFEGITSYYDDLALLRTGCISGESYLELVAQTVTRVMRGSGRRIQSIAESSFDAWTKFYKQDENAPNAIVSYYAKGALAAFGLDMLLRDHTAEVSSLDDLMRLLWNEYGKSGIGVPEKGIETLAQQLTNSDLSAFFENVIYGTGELDLESWFSTLGIGMQLRPSKGKDDWGEAGVPDEDIPSRPDLGARFIQKGDFVELLQVFDHGAAQRCGLSAGDRIIAIDNIQVTEANVLSHLKRFVTQKSVVVHAFRRDEMMEFRLPVQDAPAETCQLWFMEDVHCSEAQLNRRRAWMNLP
jgi:predicted metalloprotease with PDZ domain